MDVNLAILGTGYQPAGGYDQRFAQNWIYYKSSFTMEFKIDTIYSLLTNFKNITGFYEKPHCLMGKHRSL